MTPSAAAATAGAAVLIVDDRPENPQALHAVLAPLAAAAGARVRQAAGAEEALRVAEEEGDALAVCLLDVAVPGAHAIETARRIRQRAGGEHVPIIFVTALDADRRHATLGYQSGAVDYLTTPLDPGVVRAKVRAFLDLHRRRGEAVLRERRRYADEVQELRESALREEASLVGTVQRIGTALAAELDLERIVQLVTDEATALTGAEFGAFFYHVRDPERGEAMTLYTLAGVPREHFAHFPHPRATPVFGPTFRGEHVVRSDDITQDARYGRMAPHHGMPAGHLPVRSYLAAPVRSRTGEVLGGLFFGHAQAGVFTEREERLVVGVAGWAAIAVDNARLYAAERGARAAAEAARAHAEAAQARAEAADRAKSVFLATMSHELRTPLNAVQGYAQLLEMGIPGPLTAEQGLYVRRLQAANAHLLGLVEDVLDLSRIDAGQLSVACAPADTRPAVEAALALTLPLADAKRITLVADGAPWGHGGDAERPTVAYVGDEHRVRQILINLLANAVKFSPRGARVEVECGRVAARTARDARGTGSPPGEWTVIRVRDAGIGIAPDQLEAVFAPFVQVDAGYTRREGGTGLGLAISRRLARLMGGELTGESTPGVGSTFTLWLPAVGARPGDGRAAAVDSAPGTAAA
jgi:signal transduction histidine kinase/DNA-binding response OmpR family regulator